jgi:hypothetical protein
VLRIGYLQWHFRTRGGTPELPILRKFKNALLPRAQMSEPVCPQKAGAGG